MSDKQEFEGNQYFTADGKPIEQEVDTSAVCDQQLNFVFPPFVTPVVRITKVEDKPSKKMRPMRVFGFEIVSPEKITVDGVEVVIAGYNNLQKHFVLDEPKVNLPQLKAFEKLTGTERTIFGNVEQQEQYVGLEFVVKIKTDTTPSYIENPDGERVAELDNDGNPVVRFRHSVDQILRKA